jgi:hypothetical protein
MQMRNSVSHNADSEAKEQAGNIHRVDELFRIAGLVRSLHGKAAGVTHRLRQERKRLERGEPEDFQQTAPAPQIATNGVRWLPVPGWERFPWLWHGFSTRLGGESTVYCLEGAPAELNLGFTSEDNREIVLRNRRLYTEAVTGDPDTRLVCLRQIHSTLLVIPLSGDALRAEPRKGDGLITNEAGLLIGIQTADCIPVLVADLKRRVVAAFHAGWRGTVERIVEKGVGRMRLEFGSRPEDLLAAIGPGIGRCCYAVGEEVLSSFESQFIYARELFSEVYSTDPVRTKYPMLFLTQRAPGHSEMGPSLHLDLVEANRRQLLAAGLSPSSIQSIGGCTNCQPELFFSHRAAQGRAGRMMAVIGIRPSAAKK